MPTSVDSVIDDLLVDVIGQIVACNVIASVDNDRVDHQLVADTFTLLAQLQVDCGLTTSKQLISGLRSLATGRYPDCFRSQGSREAKRLRTMDWVPFSDPPFEATTVCRAPTLRHLVSEDHFRDLVALDLPVYETPVDSDRDARIALWRDLPLDVRRFQLGPEATLGRADQVLWFTRRDDLATCPPDATVGSLLGQRARDALGLSHFPTGAVLVAIHFSGTATRASSRRPTFLDGATHPRFRVWPDTHAARGDGDWGRTVDLAALEDDAPVLDGCPERVAGSILRGMLPDDGTFEVEMLGAVQAETGASDEMSKTFLGRLAGGMTTSGLATRLKSIVR